jgi:hypothetical protein
MGLQPGDQITFHATATDYRPNAAKSEPRRLTVITPEELTERIAARRGSILAELTRVRQMQTRSRGQVEDLEIRLGEVGRFGQLDLDHLRGAELNQRQVDHTLTSPSDGVPMHVLGLLADLENNKVDSPDVIRQMHALLDEIERLKREHLPGIGRELTSTIKAAQVHLEEQPPAAPDQPPTPPDPAMVDSLAAAGRHQLQVLASLDRMLDRLGQWDRYRRFHGLITRLLRDQEELSGDTNQLAARTLTRHVEDLLPQETADLKILARKQFDLARQLDGIQQGMEQAVAGLRETDPLSAETVSDALHQARQLDTTGRMRSAAAHIQQNQMGQAARRQEQVAQDLREILDILANRREHELGRLIKQLREAERELGEMAQRQEGLRKSIESAQNMANEAQRRRELQRLSAQQEELEEQAGRMARRLERLLAESAGQTVARAAEKMREAGRAARQGEGKTASKQAEGAKSDLDEARRQVAQRRLEAEVELALEQMARLEQTVQAAHRRQEKVLEETLRLDQLARDQGRLTRAQTATLHTVARDQELLRNELLDLSKTLVGADVFNLALSGASAEMGRAAALLNRRRTDARAQQAEQNALKRLGQLLEALKPEEPGDEPADPGSGQGGAQGAQRPPGSGLQTLVELKLLKLLQQEVNQRTQTLEAAFGRTEGVTDEARREYDQLSDEQGRLADLLWDLIAPNEGAEDMPESLPPLDEESPL